LELNKITRDLEQKAEAMAAECESAERGTAWSTESANMSAKSLLQRLAELEARQRRLTMPGVVDHIGHTRSTHRTLDGTMERLRARLAKLPRPE
jgi:hypothetical protein